MRVRVQEAGGLYFVRVVYGDGLFFINFGRMQEKGASVHEKFITVVIASIMAALFIKVLFF